MGISSADASSFEAIASFDTDTVLLHMASISRADSGRFRIYHSGLARYRARTAQVRFFRLGANAIKSAFAAIPARERDFQNVVGAIEE
jgi:hypothetical protein